MPLAAISTLPFLAAYLLLAGGSFALLLPGAGLLIVPAAPLCALLLGMARRREDAAAAAHARWQLNTIGLYLLLFLALVGIFFILGASFRDGPALDRLEAIGNAYNAGGVNLYDALARLWTVEELHALALGASLWTALALLWPLKRVFQGMLALAAGLAPKDLPRFRRLLALLTAVVAQAAALGLLAALWPAALWPGPL